MRKPGKFRNYLNRTFIRFSLMLICLMSTLFLIFIFLNFRLTTKNANVACNAGIGGFFKDQYDIYNRGIQKLAAAKEITDALSDENDKAEAYQLLYRFSNEQQIKPIFALFDANGRLMLTNLYRPNQVICQGSGKVRDALESSKNSPERVYGGVSDIPYDNKQNTVYLFSKAVESGGKTVGYLVLDLRRDSFDQFVRKNEVDMVVLTDRFDNAFYETSDSVLDSMGKCRINVAEDGSATVDGKPYYCVRTVLPDSDVKIITLTAVWEQKQMMLFAVVFLCAASALMVGLFLLISNKVAAGNARFIDELLYAVKQCQSGNIDYRINSQTFEEFQTLYDEFNQMMSEIHILLKHNTELTERKRQMEIKQLEEQFNPHFVFNIMEAIRYEILIDRKQASQMVVSFANLMRYSINYGYAQVPLRVDITYVTDYLALQKMRYNKRLTYSIAIGEELLDYKVPKLIIQPIVENCISHGAENVECIDIHIAGRMSGDVMEITVADNGAGMEEEKLNRIKAQLSREDIQPEHIGLYNAHRALKLLYGEDYGLQIESQIQKGTKVTIRIPVESGEANV